jgi:hypothetical protein
VATTNGRCEISKEEIFEYPQVKQTKITDMYSLNEDEFEFKGQKKFVRTRISEPQTLDQIVEDGVCKITDTDKNETTFVVIEGKKVPKHELNERENPEYGVCHGCHFLVILQDFATTTTHGKLTTRF